MKFLLLIAIVLVVFWLARSTKRSGPPGAPPAAAPSPNSEDMVACAECGMHLPRSEALPGRGGLFCGEPHRTAFERRQGD